MIKILGIRHHGPGSARSVQKALHQLEPDIILVEGPPDAESVLPLAASSGMKPPVALLGFIPDEPHRAVFYPFAEFSPEWQAIHYAYNKYIPVQFMDLPLQHKMALWADKKKETPTNQEKESKEAGEEEIEVLTTEGIHRDPLKYLAQVAGFQESELWWEHTFERRQNTEESFEAILEAMQTLRDTLPREESHVEKLREAYMRRLIRNAQKEGYQKIAVICGAWHAPALATLPPQKEDEELLKKLPKVKIEFTWIPWTYSRLTFASGYGAGINSPGWYQHLWDYEQDTAVSWLTKVAKLFREKDMDTSVAHVIEASRLADMLAVLRNLPRPGLLELNEATQSVLCFGDDVLLQLVHDELIVSNRLGEVPQETPKVPLQHDLEKSQQKVKMLPKADDKVYVLDLRQPTDLERSKLLHRLDLLDIRWGSQEEVSGKGTFKEQWRLRWSPELLIKVIEMGVWGNTVQRAASAYIEHQAKGQSNLSKVALLLGRTIPAELPHATTQLLKQINELAAISADVLQLMQALPPLARVSRYGNVRKTDASMLSSLVEGLVTRISISLPNACYSLDDEAAATMFTQITEVDSSIRLLQEEEQIRTWEKALLTLSRKDTIHGLVAGLTCRLLMDTKALSKDEIARYFSLALSLANEPSYAASWLEGFLKGSGMVILLDEELWDILNSWVKSLEEETFIQVLPLLRRTFATFAPAERRKIGEKAKGGSSANPSPTLSPVKDFDEARAEKALPVVFQLLGLG